MAIPRRPGAKLFLQMLVASLVTHISLAVFLNFNPWNKVIKVRPTAYTVTLMPVSVPEPEIPKTPMPPVPREEKIKPVEKIKPIEKVKPVEKPKKDDIVEKVKKKEKEKEKEMNKEALDRLQKILEETRRNIAIDEIQKKVARREQVEEKPPLISTPKSSPELESKLGSKLEDYYYKVVESKIKGEWTIPENLLKEKELVDLEAIIIIIIERDGKIQKGWFEKKSGNALYDQSAMRAIRKAEPLPPIPKELNKENLELGIRFRPD